MEAARPCAGADSLSQAMQLSNFCRDVGQDWALGRVYLPLEDLERFGYTEADLAAGRVTPRFVELMEFQFARIEGYYERREARRAGRWPAGAGRSWPGWRSTGRFCRDPPQRVRRVSRRAATGSGRKLAWR